MNRTTNVRCSYDDLLVDHLMPKPWRNPLRDEILTAQGTIPNFFATTRYNVPFISTLHSHNRFRRKRARDETEDVRDAGDSNSPLHTRSVVACGDEADQLHRFCPKCFPPSNLSRPRDILSRNRELLTSDGFFLKEYLRYGMFHCAMLRGHKECMLEMHQRGIGGEYSSIETTLSFLGAPHLAITTQQPPDMLRLLYQLGHSFSNTAMIAIPEKGAGKDADETLQLVHQFGAELYLWVVIKLLEESKLHVLSRALDPESLTGVRRKVFDGLVSQNSSPGGKLLQALFDVINRDRPDLLHRLYLFLGDMDPKSCAALAWVIPKDVPPAIQRYMSRVIGRPPSGDALLSHEAVGTLLSSPIALELV